MYFLSIEEGFKQKKFVYLRCIFKKLFKRCSIYLFRAALCRLISNNCIMERSYVHWWMRGSASFDRKPFGRTTDIVIKILSAKDSWQNDRVIAVLAKHFVGKCLLDKYLSTTSLFDKSLSNGRQMTVSQMSLGRMSVGQMSCQPSCLGQKTLNQANT